MDNILNQLKKFLHGSLKLENLFIHCMFLCNAFRHWKDWPSQYSLFWPKNEAQVVIFPSFSSISDSAIMISIIVMILVNGSLCTRRQDKHTLSSLTSSSICLWWWKNTSSKVAFLSAFVIHVTVISFLSNENKDKFKKSSIFVTNFLHDPTVKASWTRLQFI